MPTPGELRLLEILWQQGESTIDEVVAGNRKVPPPNYKTVQTVLRIMERKRLVTHSVRGRAFVFRALIKRAQVAKVNVESFVERYFAGSRSKLLLNLIQDKNLSAEELKELENLIQTRRKAL